MVPPAAKPQGAVWKLAVDVGGTFTDCLALPPSGPTRRLKVLSDGSLRASVLERLDPRRLRIDLDHSLPEGFLRGFQLRPLGGDGWSASIVGHGLGQLALDRALPGRLDWPAGIALQSPWPAPVLGARMLTQTPASLPLPPTEFRLATTVGTNALLENKVGRVALFITGGFADLLRIRDGRRPHLFRLDAVRPAPLFAACVEVDERLDAGGKVVSPLRLNPLEHTVQRLLGRGIRAAAVALMHSHANSGHEKRLGDWLRRRGFRVLSLSSSLSPHIRLLPRAQTAVVDAALRGLMDGFLDGIQADLGRRRHSLQVMTSAGALTARSAYRPVDSILSGPAAGVVGAAAAAAAAGLDKILALDMGGTSADFSRFSGSFAMREEVEVGDLRLQIPAIRVETVAAGGGSICRFEQGRLRVGPKSAGAQPGPACYGAGGPLTLTDVHLLLGRLDASRFGIPVFPKAARAALERVHGEARPRDSSLTPRAMLMGFLQIADERMAQSIRNLSVRQGYDPADHALVAFGGAGGLHACSLAEELDMTKVFCPAQAGILSARGLAVAPVERRAVSQLLQSLEASANGLGARFEALAAKASHRLRTEERREPHSASTRLTAHLRLAGQEASLPIRWKPGIDLTGVFARLHRKLYGYSPPRDSEVEVAFLEARVAAVRNRMPNERFPARRPSANRAARGAVAAREALGAGEVLWGPVSVQDRFGTVFVKPGWRAVVGSRGGLLLVRENRRRRGDVHKAKSVRLELFTRRFASVVEAMGMQLRRTALSTNIRERLDYSCALVNRRGELVVHAPHIPVHLGALGMCVRRLVVSGPPAPGQMICTNHPAYGGSHLPDVTMVSPVYDKAGRLLGYLANRAHHAEIGGIRPGSMPPDARNLAEEGVVIPPTVVMAGAKERLGAIESLLVSGPHPSLSPEENLADLRAQMAANHLGLREMKILEGSFGARALRGYMEAITQGAADISAALLRTRIPTPLRACGKLDDGTLLQAVIERTRRGLRIRLEGGPSRPDSFNATPAVVTSVVLYVFRLLAAEDIPLNEGILRNVELVLPSGLFNPDFGERPRNCPGVMAGNVETSQRLAEMLVRGLGLAAEGQGTMNNFLFGSRAGSYYETLPGGAGAGPGFPGDSGVQCNMTNTGMTDPEILEFRYPVRVVRTALRRASGGRGRWRGGLGIVRELMALDPLHVSFIGQNRSQRSRGAEGGGDGRSGSQWMWKKGGRWRRLPNPAHWDMRAGDRVRILTPGGGGWGRS